MYLSKPDVRWQDSFHQALDEMTTAEEKADWIYLGSDRADFFKIPFSEYCQRLLSFESKAPSHFVRGSTYWAIEEGQVVGRIGLRHEFNDFLRRLGGHIGYIVRPEWRNKGVATQMLSQLLLTAEAQALGSLLLTCDEGNTASEKVILNNGGKFEGLVPRDGHYANKKRYWIHLSKTIAITTACSEDYQAIMDFYSFCGYGGGLEENDVVIVALMGQRIIGAVRLTSERGLWLLRGMFVHDSFQHQGIGTRLLQGFVAALESRPPRKTFLVAPTRLKDFYKKVNFQPIADHQAPDFLLKRRDLYQSKYDRQQTVMERLPRG